MNIFPTYYLILLFCLQIQLSYQETCPTGSFYSDLIDQCQNCSNGCSTCTGYHESQCSECQPGLNKIQIENQFYCSQCIKGQYYNAKLLVCADCGIDCEMCLVSGTCLICKVGYVYNAAYKNCDVIKCDYGYYRDFLTNTCVLCPTTMQQCSSTAILDSSKVITGNSITALQCKATLQLYYGNCQCQYATFFSGNACIPCKDPNCTFCSSTVCKTCKEGYYLSDDVCVLICSQSTYYFSWSTPYVYKCNDYAGTAYKITTINSQQYCNKYQGYQDGEGCFTLCRPHQFKLYDPPTNSYRCVRNCPKDYTLDFQYMTCIKNDCTNDITYKQGGICFFRVCKLGTYFQNFISHTQKSVCAANLPNCINQSEESSNCVQCNPGYLNSYNDGQCTLTCTNINYYFQLNQCQSCSNQSNIPLCLSNNRKISYTYSDIKYFGTTTCPEGYTLSGTVCSKCTDPMLINCGTKIQYVCELGNNNQIKACNPHDLLSLSKNNQGFDSQGSVISIGATGCKTKNIDGSCKICGLTYNYNFKGTCSQKFARTTKYYFYYNNTDSQYQALESCLPNQYVSRSGTSGIRLCKDFAYCTKYITQKINGVTQNLCSECPKYYFNLNGNCIENCPNYTYKNTTAANCTTPIDNCAVYSTLSLPTCTTCRQSFARYQNGTLCIPITTCKNGKYLSVTQMDCLTCPLGCSICDSSNKCFTPSTGYYLHNYQAVQSCPQGYFNPSSGNTCLKCSQFCLTCTNESTCTAPYKGLSYYYLLNKKVYYYLSPICKANEYFDPILNKCILCDPSCASCFSNSTFCTKCSDEALALLNGTCVTPCPDGYYLSTWITANLSRKVCYKCDASCSTCTGAQSYCLTCIAGYSFYHNTCLQVCPENYASIKQQCQKKCDEYQFNPDPDTCQACKPECLTCKNASSCTLCKSPKYLQQGDCVDSCNQPFFMNDEQTACIQCTNSCEECDIGNNPPTCKKCKDRFLLDTLNNCLPCDASCSECFDTPQSCLLCTIESQVILNYTCVGSCPTGYYQTTEKTVDYSREVCKPCDPSCLDSKCISQSTTCVDGCSSGFYGYRNKCLAQCPAGYQVVGELCQLICEQQCYNLDQYTCASCKSECQGCTNGNSCINCQPQLYFQHGQCLESCSLPYFEDVNKMECIKCGSDQCAECQIKSGVATCTLCADAYILDSINNTCIACGVQEYSDPITNQCIPCDSTCNQCFENDTNCKYCADPSQKILNNKCLELCPPGYFESLDTITGQSKKVCNTCDNSCLDSICTNEASFCVTGCSEGFNFYQNRCLKECPNGFEVQEQRCNKKCQNFEYKLDDDTCLPCLSECDQCQNGESCISCKKPLFLLGNLCVSSCQIPFFLNEILNECINCGSKSCIECSFEEESGTCTKCKDGYELDELKRCIQQESDEKPKTKEEEEEDQYVNEPITYQGKIYEGEQCHYSCKQCKGSSQDEYLSCYLSTRVFFQQKYCLCADGYEDYGNQKCSLQESKMIKIGEYIDSIINYMVLIAVACDKIPVLTLLLIDIMQIGSFQIYLEQIYNYAGKLPVFKAIYYSNFSKMIFNVSMNNYDTNVGVYKKKIIILASDGDMKKELPIIFNGISTEYTLNSLPYLCTLALSFIILFILRFKNYERFQVFLNKYLIIFYYLTFQDQILFIGLQVKYLSMDSPLSQANLVLLGIAGIFNIFMIIRVIILTKQQITIPFKLSEQFKILYLHHSYFIGLLLKLINSLSVVLVSSNIRIYIFTGVLVMLFLFQIFLAIKNLKIQSKIFFIIKILICLEIPIFALTILFNEPHIAENFLNNNNLHQVQKILNTLLLFEKLGLFILEFLILVTQNNLYNYKAGLSTFKERVTQQSSLMSLSKNDIPINFELEQYQQIQKMVYVNKE